MQPNKTNRKFHAMQFRKAICFCIIFLLTPVAVFANVAVSGKYITAEGERIVLEISVPTPPPASIIVSQHLPPGIKVLEAKPPVKKYDEKKGEAKWFFKEDIQSPLVIEMRLSGPVKSGEITGEIRFVDPSAGDMVSIPLTP